MWCITGNSDGGILLGVVVMEILDEYSVPLNFSCYAVPHNCHTLFPENISLFHIAGGVWTGDYFFHLSFILCLIPFLNVAILHDCSYKGCTQSNQQLARSRLMHSIRYSGAVFPYQALDRRPTQEPNVLCGTCISNSKELNICSVYCRLLFLFFILIIGGGIFFLEVTLGKHTFCLQKQLQSFMLLLSPCL